MPRHAILPLPSGSRVLHRAGPPGGILVVCGPPLEGKGPLTARLIDELPNAVRLESVDDLSGRAKRGAEPALLAEARAIWTSRRTNAPVIIVSARFATPASRKSAAALAREIEAPFLLVESTSAPIRSLRRVSRLFLDARQITERLARYQRAKDAYVALDLDERIRLPAITLKRVLGDLDKAVLRVAEAWLAR